MGTAKGMIWKHRRKINKIRKCANRKIKRGMSAPKAFYQCACDVLKVHTAEDVKKELSKMLRGGK